MEWLAGIQGVLDTRLVWERGATAGLGLRRLYVSKGMDRWDLDRALKEL